MNEDKNSLPLTKEDLLEKARKLATPIDFYTLNQRRCIREERCLVSNIRSSWVT